MFVLGVGAKTFFPQRLKYFRVMEENFYESYIFANFDDSGYPVLDFRFGLNVFQMEFRNKLKVLLFVITFY
mgnify:CR=1 FL=1